MNSSIKKILIIVPAFNECGNIGRTVKEIRCATADVDILVIDDGSRDATAEEALNAGGMVVSLPFNLGIGAAVQTGFQYACRHQYDIAVQIDGDGQHDAGFLKKLVDPIHRDEGDMIVGSRFLENTGGFQSSFGRRLGINFFVHLINALTGVKVNDPTSGFRAYNKKMIALFAVYYPYDFPEPEAIVVAQQSGARIIEVPVSMRPREAGNSSIRYFKTLYYMVKVTLAILLHMIRQRRGEGMNIHVVALVVSVVIFLFVIDLVRRRRLTFKYAIGWLLVSAGAIFFAVFYHLLFACAALLGFELPSNFIFFALFCVFVFLSLLMTVFLCQQNIRNDIMAQKIALQEFELKELKKKLKAE